MHIHDNFLVFRRQEDPNCVHCPDQAPPCPVCPTGKQCIITGQSCAACAVAKCVDPPSSGGGGGGVSSGAIAGAVVGALVLLSACALLAMWYRRRLRAEKAALSANVKPDTPARPDDVLNRPDPVEKPKTPTVASHAESTSGGSAVRMYSTTSDSTINLDPFAQYTSTSGAGSQNSRRVSVQGSVASNPFTDTHSIVTASDSTQSTNVIPIALVPHGYVSPRSPTSERQPSQISNGTSSTTSTTPSRPARSPDLNIRLDPLSSGLNLEHINVSSDSFRPPNAPYTHSTRSGLSGLSSRASYMTSGSYSSDILSEAPQIVTPNSGAVRQVLGVAKAAVVLAPGSGPSTPLTADSRLTTPGTRLSRPPGRSPLAQTSFSPSDAAHESDSEGQVLEVPSRNNYNPFSDEHSPRHGVDNTSVISGVTVSTFGGSGAFPLPPTSPPGYAYSHNSASSSSGSLSGGSGGAPNGRPLSEATQAGSIIAADIGSAMLVRMDSTSSSVRSKNRMTSGKLVSPSETPLREEQDQYLQNQQSLAMARARIMNASTSNVDSGPSAKRTSATSVASAGGDSILESFTFVPPAGSPLAARPPRSPLSQQVLVNQHQTAATSQQYLQPPSKSSAPTQANSTTPANATLTSLVSSTSSSSGSGHSSNTSLSSLEPPRPGFRQQQTLSTASATSTGSALEGYTFKLDAGVESDAASAITNASSNATGGAKSTKSGLRQQRQRASLDTLALTADLSAFPLNFDEGRDSFSQLMR